MSNWVGFAAQVVAAFFLARILVHGLGDRRYGAWALIDSVLAYLTLFDGGLTVSVVRYVARLDAARDTAGLNRVLSTSLALFAGAGALVFAVTAGLVLAGPSLLGLAPDLAPEVLPALMLMGANLAVGLPLGIFPATLDGLGRYPTSNLIRTAGLLVRSSLVVLLANRGISLVSLAALTFACGVAENLAAAAAVRRYLPGLSLAPRWVDRETFRMIRGYSAHALVAMVAGRLSFQTDALVIGRFLGLAPITFFALAARLVEYAKNALRAATNVLTPEVSALDARGDDAGVRRVLLTGTRYVLWLILPAQLGLLLLGRPFLRLWVGAEYASLSYPVLVILAAPLPVALALSVSSRVLYGTGRLRWFARAQLAEALANLALSLALVSRWGIEGVALGTAIPNVVAGVLLLGYVCRKVGVGLGEYARRAWLAPVAGSVLPAAVWAAILRHGEPATWGQLVLTASAGLLAHAALAPVVEFGPGAVADRLRSLFQAARPRRAAS